jgi:DNA-binding NtrC family response regulator
VAETTIMVVAPEGGGAMDLPERLRAQGYRVDVAKGSRDALSRLGASRHRLVIALPAVGAEGCGGLLDGARALRPELPILVAAPQGSVQGAVQAMRHGAFDYLTAPLSCEILGAAVERALAAARTREVADLRPAATRGAKPFITADSALLEMLQTARAVAATRATVLIQGESGTGKEVLAAYLHAHSADPEAPYLAVNCAALPENLAEAELFGYERGAFTGALARKIGKFELAGEGTLVLDEISELPPALQAKLLRVLQERAVDRLGGNRAVPVNARVIAISNVDLGQAVDQGRFREDLYYRIHVLPFRIPPLRERRGDIPLLAAHFLATLGKRHDRGALSMDEATLALLTDQPWRGNVRELENAVERAVLLATHGRIEACHLVTGEPAAEAGGADRVRPGMSVRAVERMLIMKTLRAVNDNRAQAAEMLGISIRTLRNKLRVYREQPSGV